VSADDQSSKGALFEAVLRPLLFYHGGKVILNFSPEPLFGLNDVPRSSGLASLTSAQHEAYTLVQSLAAADSLKLELQPGDLTFINNHAILHARETFQDTWQKRRYAVRLWLKNAQLAWKLPRPLREGNERIYESNEVGECWNVQAVPKRRFKLSERYCS
jgi:hypothetical protein